MIRRAALLAAALAGGLAAPQVQAAIQAVVPAQGDEIQHLPMILGYVADNHPPFRRTQVELNGRDITALLLPEGPRQSTLLRPVNRGVEAFAEIGPDDGILEGENRLKVRLWGDKQNLLDEWLVTFQYRPGPMRVTYRIQERQSGGALVPLPARLHIEGLEETASPNYSPSRPDHFEPREPVRRFINSASGRGVLRLPAGRYRLVASHGLRYSLASALVGPEAGEVDLVLERVVPTPGEVAADLHVHSIMSGDSSVPLLMRLVSFLATDVDAFVATDHDHVTDFAPTLVTLPGAAERLQVVAGAEISARQVGHWNIWPLAPGDVEKILPGAKEAAAGELPARIFDLAGQLVVRPRALDAPPAGRPEGLISLNHPLGILNVPVGSARPEDGKDQILNDNVGYLANIGYDPDHPVPDTFDAASRRPNDDLRRTNSRPVPGSSPPRSNLDFDLLEVYNRNDYSLYVPTRDIWFAWLNQGIRRFAVGNSDTHTLALIRPGLPRNMVQVGNGHDTASTLTLTRLNRALAAGRSYATTGPLLSVRARRACERDPEASAGLGGTLVAPGGRFLLDVTVRAAPWVPVAELRIHAGGKLVEQVPVDTPPPPGDAPAERPVLRLARTFPLELPAGGWVVVEVGVAGDVDPETRPPADGDYALIAPDTWPLAFTNPIFIETPD